MAEISNAGKELLPSIVDHRAQSQPDQKFCVIPRGVDIKQGWREVSISDLARAVNFTSWWIERQFGPSKDKEILAYLGSNDIRYPIFVLACIKTGYTVRGISIPTDRGTVDLADNFISRSYLR